MQAWEYDDHVHLPVYNPEELRMERAKLVYELLELMMVDMAYDIPEAVAILLSRTYDLAEQLWAQTRAEVEESMDLGYGDEEAL